MEERKIPVVLSIRGEQYYDKVDPDETELMTEGTMTVLEDGFLLTYEETELTGMEGTRTTLRIKPDYVKLVRTGLYPSELVFELGKRHLSLYHTEFGDLSIVVSTQSIHSTLTDDGGELDVQYAVEVANTPVGINHLNLNIKNAEEGAIYQ